jgi:hypothetical protein
MAEHDTLAALATQIDEVRSEFSEFKSTTLIRLKKLAAALERAINAGKCAPPLAPYWAGPAKPGEREAEIGAIRDWVDEFLRVQYADWAPPRCWPRHPVAVWEVGNLYTEWQRIYADPENRSLEGALWWHERWFPGVRDRVWAGPRALLSECMSGACKLDSSLEGR